MSVTGVRFKKLPVTGVKFKPLSITVVRFKQLSVTVVRFQPLCDIHFILEIHLVVSVNANLLNKLRNRMQFKN